MRILNKPFNLQGNLFNYHRYPVTIDTGVVGAINPSQILLEIVSFANPYPYQKAFIKSFLSEYLEKADRNDMIEQFGMQGFEIQLLAKSRTAAEKLVSLIRHSLAFKARIFSINLSKRNYLRKRSSIFNRAEYSDLYLSTRA